MFKGSVSLRGYPSRWGAPLGMFVTTPSGPPPALPLGMREGTPGVVDTTCISARIAPYNKNNVSDVMSRQIYGNRHGK